jgi:hypothetical protein
MADRQKPFADDVQAGLRQQVVNVGDAAGNVFSIGIMPSAARRGDRGERVLEGSAGQRLASGNASAIAICELARARPGRRFSLVGS